jgi:hypothetical protein
MINLQLPKSLITSALALVACLLSTSSKSMLKLPLSIPSRTMSFLKKTKAITAVPLNNKSLNFKPYGKTSIKTTQKELIATIKAVESAKDFTKNLYQADIAKLITICSVGLALQPYINNALSVSAFIGLALTTKNLLHAKLKKDVFETPLCQAIRKNEATNVKALIAAGMDVNKRNFLSKQTPLILAAQYGNTEIINALIAAGADLHVSDIDKKTALDYAKTYGHSAASTSIEAALKELNSHEE